MIIFQSLFVAWQFLSTIPQWSLNYIDGGINVLLRTDHLFLAAWEAMMDIHCSSYKDKFLCLRLEVAFIYGMKTNL